jgi:hypothetical protein
MKASRGMGAVMPSKMPGKKIIHRKDNPNDVELYAAGGKIKGRSANVTTTKGGTASAMAKKLLAQPGSLKAADMFAKGGLYENIHKKRARILAGSGEKMRKPGAAGSPTNRDFINSAKTAKKRS